MTKKKRIKRYSMDEKAEMLGKARLWAVINGMNMLEATAEHCVSGVCPNHLDAGECKLKEWEERLQTNKKMLEAGYACGSNMKFIYCLEWIAYV